VPEDDDLLAGVARGDPDWGGIHRAYSKDVYAAALKVLGSSRRVVDSKDVEDIVQLTFEEAMKDGVLTPETRSNVAALRNVATRRAIDAVRRGAKIHETDIEELPGDSLSTDYSVDDFVQDDFELEIQRAIWRNQRRLSAQERTVFRARAVDGMTFPEIAAKLQLTPQRIGQIYRKVMRKLTKGIDLKGDGGDL
jgi:RNA polymerase sigma factor (sigma-70 family)